MSGVTRRHVVGALGWLPVAAAFADADAPARASVTTDAASGAPATPARTDVGADHAALADLLVRMRCAPGGGWAMWLYSGVLVVKPEGRTALPAVRIEGLSFNRARAVGVGEYEYRLDEVGYYCDVASGAVLERWDNPFTGRTVVPAHYRSPQNTRFVGARVIPAEPLPPGIEYRGEITKLAEVGGLVAATEDLYVRIPPRAATPVQPARPERISTSLATHMARAEDLAGPATAWLDSTLSYGTMNSFAGWLGMDGVPGVQNMRLVGRKLPATRLDALPPWLLERVRRDHPAFLQVPQT